MRLRNLFPGEFMDEHEEAHAAGMGLALGFLVVVTGDLVYLGLASIVINRLLERKNRPKESEGQNVMNDILREPHYFLAAIPVGAIIFGVPANLVINGVAVGGVVDLLNMVK